MNMTMKSTMTVISTAIMKTVATPMYGADRRSPIPPTAMNEIISQKLARTMESTRKTRQPA